MPEPASAPAKPDLKSAVNIPYTDLREWIAQAEKLGEIRVVKGATWQEEIGMAAELVQHDENAPCVIFDEVPGCRKGDRILTNFFGGKRKNMTLGFPLEYSKLELSEAFLENYMRELKPIPHEYVETGPVMENILTGDDIDIAKFPTPIWHDADGGRYIGTGSYDITTDPDERLGQPRHLPRHAPRPRTRVGFYISPGKHGRIHRDKYFGARRADAGGDRRRRRPAAVPGGLHARCPTASASSTGSAACAARP